MNARGEVEELRDALGVTLRVERTAEGFVARFRDIGTFVFEGGEPRFEPAAGSDEELARKLARGLILAYRRCVEGRTSLHASAAERDGRAVATLGATGSGKSTAIANLCAAHGFALLADDVVAVDAEGERFVVPPTEDSHWLREGARALMGIADDASPTLGSGVAGRPATLTCILHLTWSSEGAPIARRRLRGAEAAAVVLASTFRLPGARGTELTSDLDRAAALCARVPVWELRRPPGAALAEAAEHLLRCWTEP